MLRGQRNLGIVVFLGVGLWIVWLAAHSSSQTDAIIVGPRQQLEWCQHRGYKSPEAMEFHLVWELYTNEGQGMKPDITLEEVREKARDFMHGMGYPKSTGRDPLPPLPLAPAPKARATIKEEEEPVAKPEESPLKRLRVIQELDKDN